MGTIKTGKPSFLRIRYDVSDGMGRMRFQWPA